jgi:hypothetical protein
MTNRRVPIANVEVIDDTTVDPIVNQEFDETILTEAFMDEKMVIEVSPSPNEEDHPCVILNVNGTAHPIWRGYPVETKRKYVEVLARSKETKYKQPPRDMGDPEKGNALVGRTALCYPFQVLEDKNPKGRAWLAAVLAETY